MEFRYEIILMVLALAISYACAEVDDTYPYACDSPIYCLPATESGESVLHTVQMARLYKDSKTFVDKPLKKPERIVLASYEVMMKETESKPSQERVLKFVDENFSEEGTEFEDWEPADWTDEPPFLDKIKDPIYRDFAKDINSRWKELGRKIRPDLKDSNGTSLIYLDNPFIVPGGRFREMYYWDSYWTILGLLQSEMTETVKSMLQNFVDLVEKLGFIPNGNRIYYTRRTQPPLFISMVEEYYKVTKDEAFIRENIDSIEAEFDYWMNHRMQTVEMGDKEYKLATYNVEVDGPRPESYYEDYRDANKFNKSEDQLEFHMNMKSGAESGWDYSTKWFVGEDGGFSSELTDNKARHIMPVELNSYLCKNARVLQDFFLILNNEEKANIYKNKREEFIEAIDKVMWNDERGSWFDYDTINNKQRLSFFPSTVGPLWADCYRQTKMKEKVKSAINYLKDNQAFDYPGGVPTSLMTSGQQWDFPNAWPPLQELIVTGLENTGDPEARDLALDLVDKWVRNNYACYRDSNQAIFEKFDVTKIGLAGGGGEYDVQEGFGWTNGVLLDFFYKYGDKISYKKEGNSSNSLSVHNLVVVGQCLVSYFLFRMAINWSD